MINSKKKAVIVDHLIPLCIYEIGKALQLQWVGKRSRAISLWRTNPVTGSKELQTTIQATASIDMGKGNDYLHLQYSFNGKLVKQGIKLSALKIELTGGHQWFFICPVTGKRKRKLYLYGGRFVSKQAIDNPHFLSQTQSRKQRNAVKPVKKVVKLHKVLMQANRKNFRRYHGPDLTKPYQKVIKAGIELDESW